MRNHVMQSVAMLLLTATSAWACGGYGLHSAADAVLAENRKIAQQAIQTLRDAGPSGLNLLLATHYDAIREYSNGQRASDATWQRLRHAAAAVSGQYDGHISGLYWYTDLDQARAAARSQNKPILSLRLLGKLTDEFSCANSRFFRTTLYANEEVRQALRDRFILHWQSVRPVPKVTIDFGDGRKLERTLTGNSIHYIVDADGRPIDALPGLYGPKAFLRGLSRALAISNHVASLGDDEREAQLRQYHRRRIEAINVAWQNDLRQLGLSLPQPEEPVAQALQGSKVASTAGGKRGGKGYVSAAVATEIAMPKAAAERPLVRAVLQIPVTTLAQLSTDEVWNKIAALHYEDARLDEASRQIIGRQHPTARRAAEVAVTKTRVEDPLLRVVRNLQRSIALDTVRNEYLLHRQIHEWFAAGSAGPLDVLNERVYAELFLTPSSDPWLGLLPADTYTALEKNGVVE